MPHKLFGVVCTVVLSLTVAAAPAHAQLDWPTPPANWWTNLADGGLPSATYEANMGMTMTITQAVQSVEGTQISLSTTVSMMGNAMPGQTQVIDATSLTPEGSVAMMQGLTGGAPQDPDQALANLDAVINRIEDTTCQVGNLELECTEYEVTTPGMTARVWHAPAIPPVFLGGIVKSETNIGGQPFTMSLTSYDGALID